MSKSTRGNNFVSISWIIYRNQIFLCSSNRFFTSSGCYFRTNNGIKSFAFYPIALGESRFIPNRKALSRSELKQPQFKTSFDESVSLLLAVWPFIRNFALISCLLFKLLSLSSFKKGSTKRTMPSLHSFLLISQSNDIDHEYFSTNLINVRQISLLFTLSFYY